MKFYIEPIGDRANGIIASLLDQSECTIEIESASIRGIDGKDHLVYVIEGHNLVTHIKRSDCVKINKDFRIYILKGDLLVPSYIDHNKK